MREVDSDEVVRIVHEIDEVMGLGNGEHILAVDPGGTTGLCWCSMDELFSPSLDDDLQMKKKLISEGFVNRIEWGEITGTVAQQAWKIALGCQRLGVRIIVWESSDHFLLAPRGGMAMRKHALIPIKMAGALETVVIGLNKKGHAIVGVEQTASMGKIINDDVLGMYGVQKGKKLSGMGRHERDATRHLIEFLRRMFGGKPFGDFIVDELGQHLMGVKGG